MAGRPLISRAAVNEYESKRLANSDRIKNLPKRDLARLAAEMDPPVDFGPNPPRKHQLASVLLALKYGGYVLNLDMGLGKSYVALACHRWWASREAGPRRRMVVLVPNSVNVPEWLSQCATHAPEMEAGGFADKMRPEEKRALWESDADVVVMTYAAFLGLTCEKREAAKGGKKVGKRGKPRMEMVPSDKLIRDFSRRVLTICYDEGSMLRGHNGLYFRVARKLLKYDIRRLLLNGTPFGKDPDAMWPQFYAIDGGETLGKTLGIFREVFYKVGTHSYTGGLVWTFDDSKRKQLMRRIRHRSIRYETSEVRDMPGLHRIRVPVQVPESTWAYYERLVAELENSRGNFQLLDSVWTRMRQLTAGFLDYKDPVGQRHAINFEENPKLDAVVDLVHRVPEGRQVVVFHEYTYTGKLVVDRLRKEKLEPVWIHGKGSGRSESLEKFKSGAARVLLLQNASGAFGLNLQMANYAVFVESPADPIIRKQAEARIYRADQKHPCFIYDVACIGTKDVEILDAIEKGRNLYDDIVDGGARARKIERIRL